MWKMLLIGWKDVQLLFRDRGALILMLGAPFVLTIGLGLVTGAFSGDEGGISAIQVAVVNEDSGPLGEELVTVFTSEDLADLVTVETAVSAPTARRQVDDDEIAAAVIIPDGFSDSLIPQEMSGEVSETAVAIEVYANPARPISADVIRSIVQTFVNRVETGVVGVQVTMTQLVSGGSVPLEREALMEMGEEIGGEQIGAMQSGEAPTLIEIRENDAPQAEENEFNPLAYFAPGMAVAFLMYTVALGGRSILDERRDGTLARLLASPTRSVQVLGGKVIGIFLSGAAQVAVLIIASTLLFGLAWGNWLGVVLLVLAVALAATGWGLLLAVIAKTPSQVTNYGSALMLIFGVMGGSFVSLPDAGLLEWAGKITPNAWAIDGFVNLHTGGGLGAITTELLALLLMAALLFAVDIALFNRRAEKIMG